MSMFTDSLKRLYDAGRISLEKLQTLLSDGKISQEEYDYITGSA
jgi:hypothetical protein